MSQLRMKVAGTRPIVSGCVATDQSPNPNLLSAPTLTSWTTSPLTPPAEMKSRLVGGQAGLWPPVAQKDCCSPQVNNPQHIIWPLVRSR